MISFLASPKPWAGVALQNQEKAVKSWLTLHPDIEVILYGDAPGTAIACALLGAQHIPDIAATPQGVPYFGAIADHAAKYAKYDIQCYVNCDILFTKNLLDTTKHIPFSQFLMIGQRIDLAEGIVMDMAKPDILTELENLSENGMATLHPPAGSDYFLFPRGMWHGLPPVVIGRGGYDNALIAFCIKNGIPVIDATLSVIALHQFHDYGHVKGGASEVFDGAIALSNLALAPKHAIPTLEDAQYFLKSGNLVRNYCRGDYLRYLFLKHCYGGQPNIAQLIRLLWRIQIRIGLRKNQQFSLQQATDSIL